MLTTPQPSNAKRALRARTATYPRGTYCTINVTSLWGICAMVPVRTTVCPPALAGGLNGANAPQCASAAANARRALRASKGAK